MKAVGRRIQSSLFFRAENVVVIVIVLHSLLARLVYMEGRRLESSQWWWKKRERRFIMDWLVLVAAPRVLLLFHFSPSIQIAFLSD